MSKNILLAEDEKKLREQLLEILERHHYNVDLAEDGAHHHHRNELAGLHEDL